VKSTWARNAFFNADNFVYWASPSYVARAHAFLPANDHFVSAAITTVGIATVSSFAGLAWGMWMSRVRR
jgi:hypothetical protein